MAGFAWMAITKKAYQELHYESVSSGISIEQLQKAIIKSVQAVEKAANGDSDMIATLQKLHLSSQELISLSPDQQVKKIGISLAKVQENTERNDIAIRIFGISAIEINCLFNGDFLWSC